MACEDFKKLKEKNSHRIQYCIYDFKKHHSIVMIHWSIKLGRSCSITFHFTFYTYYYAHLMFRILKKNPLTIL